MGGGGLRLTNLFQGKQLQLRNPRQTSALETVAHPYCSSYSFEQIVCLFNPPKPMDKVIKYFAFHMLYGLFLSDVRKIDLKIC